MAFDIQYDADSNCIFVKFDGSITMKLVQEYLNALFPVLEETRCQRLLSDCSEAKIQLTSSDIIQFPKIAAKSPLTDGLKRAVVAPPNTSGFKLYEVLSRLLGQQLRVFDTREKAMTWLMENKDETACS